MVAPGSQSASHVNVPPCKGSVIVKLVSVLGLKKFPILY